MIDTNTRYDMFDLLLDVLSLSLSFSQSGNNLRGTLRFNEG